MSFLKLPFFVGLKLTLTVQEAPVARVLPEQALLASLKGTPGFFTEVIFIFPPPAFETVKVCVSDLLLVFTWPKSTAAGVPTSCLELPVVIELPIPLKDTFRDGEAGSLLMIVRFFVKVPAAVGLNMNLIIQEALTARTFPLLQVLAETLKGAPGFVTVVSVRLAVPVFVIVTVCAVDLVPDFTVPKSKEAGEGVSVPTVTPESDTVIDRLLVAQAPTASVTCVVKLYVPGALGVPLMTPVPVLKDNPVGKDPAVIAHVSGKVLPVALSV